MTITRFEDLDVWKASRSIVNSVYRVLANGSFERDYGLRDQIRRAAVSIMSNIAEGFSRRSNREFAQFLFTAKASAAEVQSQLYIALDQRYLTQTEFDALYSEADSCARQLSGLITYLLRRTQQTQQTRSTQQTQRTQ